jgi:hypothetical protein
MGKSRVLNLRLVGFVELFVFATVRAIDAIDESINPIDEKLFSRRVLRRLLLEILGG